MGCDKMSTPGRSIGLNARIASGDALTFDVMHGSGKCGHGENRNQDDKANYRNDTFAHANNFRPMVGVAVTAHTGD